MKKAAFLDRDGVLVQDTGYPYKKDGMRILPGASEALKRLGNAGYLIVVVSNQSGIARGLFQEKDTVEFNRALEKELEKDGSRIDAFYFCPHHPEGKIEKYRKICECRKPRPGMLLQAAKEHEISLPDSWMIGDKEEDSLAGKAAGCRTIRIGEREGADFSSSGILDAAGVIFENETGGKLLNENKLEAMIKNAKSSGKKVVFTNGCFDILHAGHVDYLRKAKAFGDLLVIGLNSDASTRRIKGPKRPVNGEFQRAKVLSALGCVDYIAIFDEDTPERLVEKFRPDVYAKGGDWKPERLPEKKIVERYGGKVALIGIIENTSTTKTMEKITSQGG